MSVRSWVRITLRAPIQSNEPAGRVAPSPFDRVSLSCLTRASTPPSVLCRPSPAIVSGATAAEATMSAEASAMRLPH